MTSGGVRVDRSGPVTTVIMNRQSAQRRQRARGGGLYEAFDN
jgi:hypothetical protein